MKYESYQRNKILHTRHRKISYTLFNRKHFEEDHAGNNVKITVTKREVEPVNASEAGRPVT